MCKCSCECKTEDRRESLLKTLDELYALQKQTEDDIKSVKHELNQLNELEEIKEFAYEGGSKIKAMLDSYMEAGLTEEQALAIITSYIGTMNGAEVHVEL